MLGGIGVDRLIGGSGNDLLVGELAATTFKAARGAAHALGAGCTYDLPLAPTA